MLISDQELSIIKGKFTFFATQKLDYVVNGNRFKNITIKVDKNIKMHNRFQDGRLFGKSKKLGVNLFKKKNTIFAKIKTKI